MTFSTPWERLAGRRRVDEFGRPLPLVVRCGSERPVRILAGLHSLSAMSSEVQVDDVAGCLPAFSRPAGGKTSPAQLVSVSVEMSWLQAPR